ncbi:hypothetical protein M8756_05630 [Lutimaribacter sp. EGI FJ00015]|nr:hypothetical protein [Lutimaribacter sp. EGI FJ00015]MCO0635438.1 hypothetical protein [Lutimaribacter sp. EGI FJ00014]
MMLAFAPPAAMASALDAPADQARHHMADTADMIACPECDVTGTACAQFCATCQALVDDPAVQFVPMAWSSGAEPRLAPPRLAVQVEVPNPPPRAA